MVCSAITLKHGVAWNVYASTWHAVFGDAAHYTLLL